MAAIAPAGRRVVRLDAAAVDGAGAELSLGAALSPAIQMDDAEVQRLFPGQEGVQPQPDREGGLGGAMRPLTRRGPSETTTKLLPPWSGGVMSIVMVWVAASLSGANSTRVAACAMRSLGGTVNVKDGSATRMAGTALRSTLNVLSSACGPSLSSTRILTRLRGHTVPNVEEEGEKLTLV